MIGLDLACAIINFLAAGGAFLIFILSSPKKRIWFPLERPIRCATFGFGLAMAWRAADFLRLSHHPYIRTGHADLAAFVGSLLALAYWTIGARSMLRSAHSPKTWRKMGRIAEADRLAEGAR